MKKELKRKRSKEEKGITLIALVVTIIILLILAGVTLNAALSDNGLFQMAKKSVNEYKKAEETESREIEELADEIEGVNIDYNNYVGAKVTGYEPTKKIEGNSCIIKKNTSGADKEQIFITDTDMEWRIWDYNRNTNIVRLISSKPTKQKLILKNVNGYNNGVWAINEICRQCYGQYDTDKKMIDGIEVANLRRTDIQKVITYDYKDFKHEEDKIDEYDPTQVLGVTPKLIHFGEGKKYENDSIKYPAMWKKDNENWTYEWMEEKTLGVDDEAVWEKENESTENTDVCNGGENDKFKQSIWRKGFSEKDEISYIDDEHLNLLSCKLDGENCIYWLSTRGVFLMKDKCDFGMSYVNSRRKCWNKL